MRRQPMAPARSGMASPASEPGKPPSASVLIFLTAPASLENAADQRCGVSGLSGDGGEPEPGCSPGDGISGDEASAEDVFGAAVGEATSGRTGSVSGSTTGCTGFGSGATTGCTGFSSGGSCSTDSATDAAAGTDGAAGADGVAGGGAGAGAGWGSTAGASACSGSAAFAGRAGAGAAVTATARRRV